MKKIQDVLAIAEGESEDINKQISEFIQKCGEIILKMMISDPPLLFDCRQIGMKVSFNQHKYESLDGFIKANEECLTILPSVYKLVVGQNISKEEQKASNGNANQ